MFQTLTKQSIVVAEVAEATQKASIYFEWASIRIKNILPRNNLNEVWPKASMVSMVTLA